MVSTPEILVHGPEDGRISKLETVKEEPSSYPSHPIPQLQGPFEESIVETDGPGNDRIVNIDAQTRRRDLLENDKYERLCGRRWRQLKSEKYHPFWKLISQMIFGVHLLAKGLARSETSVMKILQNHVNELDGFLERTTEDLMIVRLDVHTRIQYLSLPLANLDVFDEMLVDRGFRLSIVAYNDQIEHSIDRFTQAITDALKDLQKAKEAMGALWFFFKELSNGGCFSSDSLQAFYQAMMENMEGWIVAISKLRRQGTALQKALSQLGLATTEMQRRVGVASRKDVRSFIKQSNKIANRSKSVKQRLFERRSSAIPEKPLPLDPFSKPKRSQTTSKHLESRPTTAKDQPDTPSNPTASREGARRILSRAKSCSALATEATNENPPPPPVPSTSVKLKRRLSKPFLYKRSTSEKAEPTRPQTAPQPLRPSRSISIEQLRAFCTSRPPTRQSMVKSPTQARQETTDQLNGRDTMKDQISQFLKTDRVIEAWDSVSKGASCCARPIKSKEWPSSIFRTKSTSTLDKDDTLSGPDLERQMSWVQETFDVLPTHSFKTKPEMSPRIHVLSVQMTLDEEVAEREASLDLRSDGSLTALPAVPPPPIPAIALEHRSTLIDCAQG
ncbi:unnamed protein product [Penicillium salamii]|uniref:Uncharacterized protein n=1 Tax=Penicillium salamii TaxID=1612424 RepID=A0A9W4JK17_9EURO|nr:unnamed protein product [Penicillium salamii]CAG8174677.1 unnamed protein product [Penicillium salamii]CAG8200435.1 unnamed protein product [Penicillium salamii]CAG8270485.1 unnamed protein product [Penicillium salamii]CAG8284733.1 unnamed protein product [Penicillium salamii]